jgi:hypothetical protein
MTESLKSLIRERASALPEARRGGYDHQAVDNFITELLEHIDELEAKPVTSTSRRHVERMSEKMAELLDTAEENASELLGDARREAEQVIARAREEAGEASRRAEADARSQREAADGYAAKVRNEVETEIDQVRQSAESEAREKVAVAERRAAELVASADARRQELEKGISQLENRRGELVQILRRVSGGLEAMIADVEGDAGGGSAGERREVAR